MAKFHQLEFLWPRDFLSFGPGFPGIRLGPLNLLVGANGSGKSNFIDAARFLHAAPDGLRAFLTQGGSTIPDWCYNDSQYASVDVHVSGPGQAEPLHYRLEIENQADARLVDETLQFTKQKPGKSRPFFFLSHEAAGIKLSRKNGAQRSLVSEDIDPSLPVISQIRDRNEYPEMDWMRRHLSGYQFMGEAHFGRQGNELRQAQSAAQPQESLLESGRNLPLILSTLHLRTGFRQALLEHVREVYPLVDQIEVGHVLGQVQVVFVERSRGRHTPASRLSDGTMRWLFLGVLLLDEQRNSPLFLEEPELALHPDAIIPLARLLKRASQHRQIVVTTHSDALLREFTETPDIVLVFDRDEYGTSVRRLASDDTELQAWLAEGHSLAEIWRSGVFGGNRW